MLTWIVQRPLGLLHGQSDMVSPWACRSSFCAVPATASVASTGDASDVFDRFALRGGLHAAWYGFIAGSVDNRSRDRCPAVLPVLVQTSRKVLLAIGADSDDDEAVASWRVREVVLGE